MKKSLFILTFVSAFLCACNKLAPVPEMVCASFDVSMDNTTKAAMDGDGAAAHVNRCILQIWKGDEVFRTVVRTAPEGTRRFSFRGVLLEPGQTYDFLFWADCGTAQGGDLYYLSQSLKNVSLIDPSIGNNDALDAFCGRILGCDIDDEYEFDLILRRPLAQLNVITADLPALSALPLGGEFIPEVVSYSYTACTAFDVREGRAVGKPVLISVKDAPVYGRLNEDVPLPDGKSSETSPAEMCTLAMSYLFPEEGESVSSLALAIRNENGSVISSSYENIPFRTNWRTNVTGNVLTEKGTFSIQLVPLFDGEITAQQ